MIYELFDTETSSVIGVYESQAEAPAVLKSAIKAYGASYADPVILGRRDADGYPEAVAEGWELARMALAAEH